MEFERNCCRFCLTTDEDNGFKSLSAEVLKKVAVFNVSIADATIAVICRKCEADIDSAQKVYNQILDAQDYFEMMQKMKSTEKAPETSGTTATQLVFECDACAASFKSMKTLEAHIVQHNCFACFFCSDTFSSGTLRRAHLVLNHKDLTMVLMKKQLDH